MNSFFTRIFQVIIFNYRYMKRIFLLIVFAGTLVLVSCKKSFLDLKPLNNISEENVWKNASLIRAFVTNIYNGIEPGIALTCDNMNGPIAIITDEARSAYTVATSNTTIITGAYSTSSAPLNNWTRQYANIRNTNLFLDNIGSSPITEDEKKRLTGEIKFLRALAYFELVKRFGGVPIITAAQSLSDDLMVPRSTMEQCFTFIEEDLNEAISTMPNTSSGGLANKWAAVALKSRAMLYAASYAQYGVMDPDGFGAIPSAAAAGYWQKAYDAAADIVNSGPYTLVTNLNTLFIPKGATPSSESIFEIQYSPPLRGHGFHYVNAPRSESPDWTSCTNPSQQLVDAFPMKNGLPITDPGSGYNPQDPYTNRDARLDASIFRHGLVWRDLRTRAPLVMDMKPGAYNGIVEPDVAISVTHTGYYVRKFIDPDVTVATQPFGQNFTTSVEIRLGEVLLNLAEAAVELNKATEAVTAIKKLRDRAGTLTPLSAATPIAELRNIVRNERLIELCFENHRLWDLRRWRKAEEVLHGLTVKGMWITDVGGGVLNYQVKTADVTGSHPRTFLAKHYLFPIPFSEIQRNTALKQNPQW